MNKTKREIKHDLTNSLQILNSILFLLETSENLDEQKNLLADSATTLKEVISTVEILVNQES